MIYSLLYGGIVMNWWEEYFSKYYYNTAFSVRGKAKQEIEFILSKTNVPKNSNVLDMCCGYGRHSIELALKGLNTTGIDYSSDLIRMANDELLSMNINNLTFKRGDIRKYISPKNYDLVICLYMSFGYFSDLENEIAFHNLSESLNVGGYLVIELYNPDQVKNANFEENKRMLGGKSLYIHRRYNKKSKRTEIERVITNRDGKKEKFDMSIRVYSVDELTEIALINKLNFVGVYGDYFGNELGENSEKMIVIYRKEEVNEEYRKFQ